MHPHSSRGSLFRLSLSLLIMGTIGVFRRFAPVSSAFLAFTRGLIGGLTILICLRIGKKLRWRRLSRATFCVLALNGVFLGLNWILLFEAYRYTSIAVATLCYYLEPTIMILLSPLVFRERLTARRLICAGVSLLGMVLVSGIADAGAGASPRGVLLGLGAACFYTLVVILNKKTSGVDSIQKTVIQLFSTAGALLPYLLLTRGFPAGRPDGQTLLVLMLTGVVHTGLAYALYFDSISRLPAQTVSMLSYLDPVVALLASFVVFRETLTPAGLLGAVLILGSAFVSESGVTQPGCRS